MWTCSEAEMGEGRESQQDPKRAMLGETWDRCGEDAGSLEGADVKGLALLPWSKDGAQKVPEPEEGKGSGARSW